VLIWNILIFLIVYVAMEGVAWSAHKFLMHGPLWVLHKDHHQREPGFFEKNDLFFVIFAIPSMTGFIVGYFIGISGFIWGASAIAAYGASYFLIHDVLIHQRFKWLRNVQSPYFRAIRKAHKVHHKHLQKEDGECFGMLYVPPKYYREALRSLKK